MKYALCSLLTLFVVSGTFAQTKPWSDTDRKYLLENLKRTRDEVINETKNLTPAQWNFKEAPDKWSINQVVEHLSIWELLLQREISMALIAGFRPELHDGKRTDSSTVATLMEDKIHIATEYTKPFTFTVPMGLNDGKNNLATFLKMRNEGIGYVDSTTTDLRGYLLRPGRGNVHQVFITIFAHSDRHLRQVRRIKANVSFPK